MKCSIPALVCLGLFCSAAHAAGDPQRGRELATDCMGCHGIPSYNNVYPTYHVPRLGGQHADYIVAALKEYKSGNRSHKTMHAQAASLSEQDMQDLAAWFSTFPRKDK
ncbi:MAG: cytochrome c [Gammaproteobacteria bacterium]|nr:MAG: cytochrome c [Gammaproteobacteria bacterium]